jgi:phospholipid/cholesterol/gamma-HCH transport system substrate-binding protein
MRSFRDRNPYAVGLVSVLVIAGLTGLAFAVGMLRLLEDTYTVRAEFADAAGLRTGDDVRVAGVKVGRVDGVDVEREEGRILVTMEIDSGIEIRDQATAEISLATLLGSKYVRIDEAVEGEHELEGYCSAVDADADDDVDVDVDERADGSGAPTPTTCLDDAPLIPYERAGERVPFDIFELTRIATEGIQELDTDGVNDFVADLADLTEGRRESLTELVTTIDDVSVAVTSRDQQLGELLTRAESLSRTLAEKDETLVALIDQSRAILALLDQRRAELAAALGDGAEAVTGLADLIDANAAELDRLLTNLHPIVDAVAAEQDDVDRALAWAGPGFLGQTLAGSHGPWLDIFVRALGPDLAAAVCDVLAPTGECQGGTS